MNYMVEAENIKNIVDIIKIFFICMGTYYMEMKIINKNLKNKYLFLEFIGIVCISIISKFIKQNIGFLYSIIGEALLLSLILSKNIKKDYIYSIIITTISLSINYVLFAIGIFINFIVNIIISITNDYINLIIMLIIYWILVYNVLKIKKIKNGLAFLKEKLENEYIDIFILNISMIVLLSISILSNYDKVISRKLGTILIIFSIIMFITIKKSLEIYYKQKLLIQDLEETKKELEDEKHENKELEKEILEYSKKSHSIAHKQKALEYKLNELMLKSEVASEIGLQDELSKISKEIQKDETVVELTKTGILEIDDMLKYMQSECTKNKIDFQLKVSGNIHYMVNNYVDKENLEILIADHIKNAIIAIQNSSNANKSILVRLGIIDGYYSLYIYDSGIEFEIETLKNLGKKPSTTHKDTGGTGIGFMNTFETLNKFKASIIIKEYNKPVKDNFTKLITIKFDNKNEYKIYSYRAQEIRKEVKNHELEIEDI